MISVSERLRRLGIVLLVLAVVAQPIVGSAAAASSSETPEECERSAFDAAKWVAPLVGVADEAYHQGECTEAQAHQNATHTDIFASGLTMADMQESSQVGLGNNLEYSRTVVRAKAKAEALKAFKNGSNLTSTQSLVNKTVEEYYATLQSNLIETHNSQYNQLIYNQEAANQEGLGIVYVEGSNNGYEDLGEPTDIAYVVGGGDWGRFTNHTAQLVNGSNVSYRGAKFRTVKNEFTDSFDDTAEFGIENPTNSSQHYVVYDGEYYKDSWTKIQSMSSGVKSNASAWTSDLYATYDNYSELNIEEIVDPLTMAQEFNTNLNSTGSYGWQAAEIGLTGVEGTVNESFAITYSPNENHTLDGALVGGLNGSGERSYIYTAGETYNLSGTFFTAWSPNSTNGSFVSGTTYNTSNAGSPVMFVVQTENGTHTAELQGEFTINELTDVTTGETINQTTLENKTLQTWNASFTRDEMRSLLEYRDDVSGTYSTGGSGGGGFGLGGLSLGGAAIGGLLALGGALLVLDRFPGSAS